LLLTGVHLMKTLIISDVYNEAPAIALQDAAARLLSEIKCVCRTSQKAVDELVSGVNSMIDLYIDVLKVMSL